MRRSSETTPRQPLRAPSCLLPKKWLPEPNGFANFRRESESALQMPPGRVLFSQTVPVGTEQDPNSNFFGVPNPAEVRTLALPVNRGVSRASDLVRLATVLSAPTFCRGKLFAFPHTKLAFFRHLYFTVFSDRIRQIHAVSSNIYFPLTMPEFWFI